jgi:hypothetical protein
MSKSTPGAVEKLGSGAQNLPRRIGHVEHDVNPADKCPTWRRQLADPFDAW